MAGEKTNISWESIGKIILALSAGISGIVLLINFLNSRSPQITVRNELGFPVKIYSGEDYQGLVPADSKRTFRFYSEKVFPVQISWEGVRQKTQNGDSIGELVTGSIEYVDNHQVVAISHTAGKNDYFMPILSNQTDMTCKIVVNDGLPSEKYGGVLSPQKQRVNVGYYKWIGNSNVTLYCDDGPHWWGDRKGVSGPDLKVQSPSGEADLTLSP